MRRYLLTLTLIAFLTACEVATTSDESTPPGALVGTPNPSATISTDAVIHSPPETITPMPSPEQPYAPQAGDDSLTRSEAYLNSVRMLILESYPPQVRLILQGDLPTPCHSLRVVVNQPDNQSRIIVEVYSVTDPNAICVQVLEPFNATIPLGSFPQGHYSVWVNGEQIGEFDS